MTRALLLFKTDEKLNNAHFSTTLIYDCLQHPSIFMPFVDNFFAFCGNGMIESMMEPHLKDAGATQTQVGYSFLLNGLVYMITSPIIGFVSTF